ncbi:hypothetical protein CUJ84_Chr003689 [Rhizobium leguminosarum]|uniref:Uncharacterized protein n=1 Tax=Rhizobium leguminosarum TaxID=384 RepID=A0A2K9Z764_RHILE|nr:hypothetical protein CUJ84_Chr003689 [Rhizobium leguminosarum]
MAIDGAARGKLRCPEFGIRCGFQAIFGIVFSSRLTMTIVMLRRSMTFYSNDLREICASR